MTAARCSEPAVSRDAASGIGWPLALVCLPRLPLPLRALLAAAPVQPQPLANPHLGCINEIDQGNEADTEEASSASVCVASVICCEWR